MHSSVYTNFSIKSVTCTSTIVEATKCTTKQRGLNLLLLYLDSSVHSVVMTDYVIRELTESDLTSFVQLIQDNAKHLNLPSPIIPTSEQLKHDLLDPSATQSRFHVLVCEFEEALVGYALYLYGYSTWDGRTMYPKEFYVADAHKDNLRPLLLKRLMQIAEEMKCGRTDWLSQTDWVDNNEFWIKSGGFDNTAKEQWHQYRLSADKFPGN